jgi:hypothetical protein
LHKHKNAEKIKIQEYSEGQSELTICQGEGKKFGNPRDNTRDIENNDCITIKTISGLNSFGSPLKIRKHSNKLFVLSNTIKKTRDFKLKLRRSLTEIVKIEEQSTHRLREKYKMLDKKNSLKLFSYRSLSDDHITTTRKKNKTIIRRQSIGYVAISPIRESIGQFRKSDDYLIISKIVNEASKIVKYREKRIKCNL